MQYGCLSQIFSLIAADVNMLLQTANNCEKLVARYVVMAAHDQLGVFYLYCTLQPLGNSHKLNASEVKSGAVGAKFNTSFKPKPPVWEVASK